MTTQIFRCEDCNVGFATQPEWDKHLGSYGHNHLMNRKNMRKVTAAAGASRKRARPSGEDELVRLDVPAQPAKKRTGGWTRIGGNQEQKPEEGARDDNSVTIKADDEDHVIAKDRDNRSTSTAEKASDDIKAQANGEKADRDTYFSRKTVKYNYYNPRKRWMEATGRNVEA